MTSLQKESGWEKEMESPTKKAFANPGHNILHLRFPNGNALSTIWTYESYTENFISYRDRDLIDPKELNQFLSSDTVEIMILSAPEELKKKISEKIHRGDPYHSVTMDEWLYIVKELSK